MVSTLSIAEQQQVEIARALVHESRILIMDEPTAALSDRETEQLFRIIEEQRDKGLAVLYISHRMAEVERLARRITVLRDGASWANWARMSWIKESRANDGGPPRRRVLCHQRRARGAPSACAWPTWVAARSSPPRSPCMRAK
jgi:ABC-type multidrug transport system ATPase subunit